MKYLTCISAATAAVLCLMASAGDITLPDNRVLQDAYVMSERPDGLEIGHKNGVMFVSFADLPESLQKQYNYNPEKAAKYRAEVAAAKERRLQDQAKRNAEMQKFSEEEIKRSLDMQFEQLGQEIQQYESRIEFLKSEIPRLEKKYSELLDKASKMELEAADTDTYYGGCWGGFLSKGGAKVTMKKQMAKKVSDEAADTKDELESDKKELVGKQNILPSMKERYDRMKAQQGKS